MDEKHTQQFAQNSSERASLVPSEDLDFLSLLASVQSYETNKAEASQAETNKAEFSQTETNQPETNQTENAIAETKSNEEKHRHHLWHRLSANQNKDNKSKDAKAKDTQSSANSAPHFTPLPSAPKSTDFGKCLIAGATAIDARVAVSSEEISLTPSTKLLTQIGFLEGANTLQIFSKACSLGSSRTASRIICEGVAKAAESLIFLAKDLVACHALEMRCNALLCARSTIAS